MKLDDSVPPVLEGLHSVEKTRRRDSYNNRSTEDRSTDSCTVHLTEIYRIHLTSERIGKVVLPDVLYNKGPF